MSKHLSKEIRVPIDKDNPAIMRNEELCIKCGQCKRICTDHIGIHDTYELENTNDNAVCINCGQCANVCPVSSITEKYEYEEVKKKINDPNNIVIFSISPSVRVALGEEFNMPDGEFVIGKTVKLLRNLGARYVLDTNFAADLTIVEEASELIERITKKTRPLPQFTSCCPAWVKYCEMYHPELLENISSAKSPIGMQGPTIKTYFAKAMGIDPKRIVNVALTPCTAKKYEIRREEMNSAAKFLSIPDMRDMDNVITTRELAKWAKEENIDLKSLEESPFDKLMGEASGAGVIFGNTGGVMQAALRTAYCYVTGNQPPEDFYDLQAVRGMEGIKEAVVEIGPVKLNVCVISGTANAEKVIDEIKNGNKSYDFIEVMTCPGGCIGGGGQPKGIIEKGNDLLQKRIDGLYNKDEKMTLRLSHENPEIKELYEKFYNKPLSPIAEQMLHTIYSDKSNLLGAKSKLKKHSFTQGPSETNAVKGNSKVKKWRCKICGYECEGENPPEICPICNQPASEFEEVK